MHPIFIWSQMVGVERLGKMLDSVLSKLRSDEHIPLPVLRGMLRGIAVTARDGPDADGFVVKAADLYVVASVFPTGADIDDLWDFFGHVTYSMLLDSMGKLGIAADFEAATIRLRWPPKDQWQTFAITCCAASTRRMPSSSRTFSASDIAPEL